MILFNDIKCLREIDFGNPMDSEEKVISKLFDTEYKYINKITIKVLSNKNEIKKWITEIQESNCKSNIFYDLQFDENDNKIILTKI